MMECVRCGGLAVAEYLQDLHGTFAWIEMLRCLNCGHIQDPVRQPPHINTTRVNQQERNR